MHSLGRQIIAEFYDCDPSLLDSVEHIAKTMREAALKAGATIVTETFHRFSPYGVSGAIIIAESHLAIHTWPEHGYAAVDLFTCGSTVRTEAALQHLRLGLKARHISTLELKRGLLPMMREREELIEKAS